MNFMNSDYEELEPRATPQPTVLNCMTDPSVPEVSLIFGKESQTAQIPPQNRISPSQKCRAYVNWKTSGYPSPIDQRLASQKPITANSSSERPLPSPTISQAPSNIYGRHAGPEYSAHALSNSSPSQYNQSRPFATQNDGPVASGGHGEVHGIQMSHQRASHYDVSADALPRAELMKTPNQNGSYNAVKSILKSSLSNNASGAKGGSENFAKSDSDFHGRSPLRSSGNKRHEHPRQTDVSLYSRSSPVSRCQRSSELTNERDTVRDLLLLVKNQNDQIKTLQTQVERLLEIHENSVGRVENRRPTVSRANTICQSPTDAHEIDSPMKNNVVLAAQKTCRSREINVVSCFPGDEQPEGPMRFQSEPLRNTIMEKKVSIGVMTSFEFSVQNNPFVTDAESPPNIAHRDCAKNMTRSSDAWGSKVHCSRKIPTGPLENISEDTESHPSSIGRASSNNTQISSPEKLSWQPAANINSDAVRRCPNSNEPQTHDKNSSMFTSKPAAYSSEMYENVRAQNEALSEMPKKQDHDLRNLRITCPKNLAEVRRPAQNHEDATNDYNGATEPVESNGDENFETGRNDLRYSELSKFDARSMPAENTGEGSLILRSSDFHVADRTPPSLDPSIHVEMREYSSDEETEESKRAPAVGWTFYKNVVGQVNRILHTIPTGQDIHENEKIKPRTFANENIEKKDILSSVKTATLEQLKMLGISYAEHSQFNNEHTQKKVTFDSSYIPSVDCQINVNQPSNSITETNTSMHMKALALKYLSDEQLADLALHQQGTTMKQKFLSVQGTNMSFATMNYLQRYCLVSGVHTLNPDGKALNQAKPKPLPLPKEPVAQPPTRNPSFDNSLHRTVSDNILDMTTLKQQPKLL